MVQKLVQSQSNFQVLSSAEQEKESQHPEVAYIVKRMEEIPVHMREHAFADLLSLGQATAILQQTFSPQGEVPPELSQIFDVFENTDGVIVSYNYDRIARRQTRFPVITPHGESLPLPPDSAHSRTLFKLATEFHIPLPTDWHLPLPEDAAIRYRSGYQQMLKAYRRARTMVFVGYGFGAGADAISFEDFAANVSPTARIHVLCPPPDNADLCKQIGSALRGCHRGFRVYSQPFGWSAFTDAVLRVLRGIHGTSSYQAIGLEAEILRLHDQRR